MHPQPDRSPATRLAPLPLLFARYVAGQIEDPFWDQFMQVLDANETTPQERLALAAFFNDAFAELKPEQVRMPKSEEVRELLTVVFASPAQPH